MFDRPPIDLDFVRARFPALAGEWIFFDNAGGSQILGAVLRRIDEYLRTSNVQLGASYETSRLAGERVDAGAGEMARLINAADLSEVVIGPSTTALLRNLAISLSRTLAAGDEIVVTNCDHEANIGGWVDLERFGVKVRFWRLDPETLRLRADDLEKLLTPKTRLVALTHASNVLGTINPVREIARLVHDRGARICVDGVAYAPHRRVDVRELDVDFYALSLYKVYGPHCALLYGKREQLLSLPPINHFFIAPAECPYHLQPGSVNYELCYGLAGIGEYVDRFAEAHGFSGERAERPSFFFERVAEHEEHLAERLLDFLRDRRNVRIIGEPVADRSVRLPTVSFVADGKASDAIVAEVDRHRIGIRYGDFYARRLIDDLGLAARNGVVRVSMVHYNTTGEVDRLLEALDEAI